MAPPKRLPVGPLMDYGYEGTPWLLTTLTAPADAKRAGDPQGAHASWLVCQQICVPEDATLTLTLPVGDARRPIRRWRKISPRRARCCRWPRPGN